MAAPPPAALRCSRNEGRGWPFKDPKQLGSRFCSHHNQPTREHLTRSKQFDLYHEDVDYETGMVTRSKKMRRLSELYKDDETRDKGSASHPEAKPARGLYSQASPNRPHKCLTQPLEGQLGPRADTDTISSITFKSDWSPVMQSNSILECPAAATAAGQFINPQNIKLEKVEDDELISATTLSDSIFISKAVTESEFQAKRLHGTPKGASLVKGLKEENQQLKAEVVGMKIQCRELKTKTKYDAFEIQILEHQLIAERVRAVEAFSRGAAITVADLRAEKDELVHLLEQSRDEIATKRFIIGELLSSNEKLERKVAYLTQREADIDALRNPVLLAGQLDDSDVKQARQAGYSDGFMDGRRLGWTEFVKLQQQEPSKPGKLIQSCATILAGCVSPAL